MQGIAPSSAIDAAVAALAPDATPTAKPAKRTKAPAAPPDPFDVINHEMAEIHGDSPRPGRPARISTPPRDSPKAQSHRRTRARARRTRRRRDTSNSARRSRASNSAARPRTHPQTRTASSSENSPQLNPDDPAVQDRIAEALELSISGSVGFWVAVGLLACWSMQENEDGEPHSAAPSPKA